MTTKALTHWIIYKGYKVRFRERSPEQISGILNTPEGDLPFTYLVADMQVRLPGQWFTINEHGWELRKSAPPAPAPQDSESH